VSDTRTVECGACGTIIDEPTDTPAEERQPCPECGSTSRTFNLGLASAITATSSMSATVIRAPEAATGPTEHLEEFGFKVTWRRYPDGLYFVEVHDDAGNLLDVGGGDDPEDCILGVAERLLPPNDRR
jgi:hypothetical protein